MQYGDTVVKERDPAIWRSRSEGGTGPAVISISSEGDAGTKGEEEL
jgi:hypothetical protein